VLFKRSALTSASGTLQDAITVSFADDGTKTDYYLFRIRKSDGNYAKCINTKDSDIELLITSDPFSNDLC